MAQQTAVEWFADKLDELIPFVNEKTAIDFNKLFEQAKEIDKLQKIDAYLTGCILWDSEQTAEEYYTETYGK